MTPTEPTTTPTTDLLSLLGRYEALRAPADASLKSSMWNLTRARRGRSYQSGGGIGAAAYAVDDVREELRARAVVEWREDGEEEEAPGLVDEGSSGGKGEEDGGSSGGAGFVLHLDGMRAATERAEGTKAAQRVTKSDFKQTEGLRRRKGNASSEESKDSTNKWTSEAPGAIDDEEERLRNADPLNLFGVPPPALRTAQADARSAVAYYVEVANLARGILELTTNGEGGTGAD